MFYNATNDDTGKISFNLQFDATNLGYEILNLSEVNEGKPGITYDTHTEEIIVAISDNGERNLVCELQNPEPKFDFINSIEAKSPDSGSLTELSTTKKNHTNYFMTYVVISGQICSLVYLAIKITKK